MKISLKHVCEIIFDTGICNDIMHHANNTHIHEIKDAECDAGSTKNGSGDADTFLSLSGSYHDDKADGPSSKPKLNNECDQTDLVLARGSEEQQKRRMQKKDVPVQQIHQSKAKFCLYDMALGIIGIVVFIFDIVTDILMVVHFLKEERYEYAGVTAALVVVSSIITCMLGLHWYLIDYQKEKKKIGNHHMLTLSYIWVLRILFTLLMLGPVVSTLFYFWIYAESAFMLALWFHFTGDSGAWFHLWGFVVVLLLFALHIIFQMVYDMFFHPTRNIDLCLPCNRIIEYLYFGQKSRNVKCSIEERERFKQAMLYKDLNSCLLRLFESFLESAPQLAWQIYIAIKLKRASDTISITLLAFTLLSSWMSLAISLLSYHKSLRNANDYTAKMTFISLPFYFIWRLSEVGGRILCIAFFASAFQLWVFGVLACHWVAISAWLIMQNTSFYRKTFQEKLFNLICSFVMIFCFLNMREGHTRFRFILFYFWIYAENAFMLALWFRFTGDLGAWFHLWGFVVVLLLFALHIIFQMVYYTFFHPTRNIDLCLPCNRYTIYSSMCDDVNHSNSETTLPASDTQTDGINEGCSPMLINRQLASSI